MPVTASAKKALRSARAKTGRNALVKAELKRALKNAIPATVSQVVSLVDKAAKRHLMHVNKAARIKSRLARLAAGIVPTKTLKKRKTAKRPVSKKKTH